jgi:putative salt-induced outer membrane protein YdiY
MSLRPSPACRYVRAALVCFLALAASAGFVASDDSQDDWKPTSEYVGKFDWVQMKSGEWVKGEIIVMYDDDLEFDSDEFDDLTLGWDDIQQIHSSRIMNVGLLNRRSAVGQLIVDGDRVTVIGDQGVQEFTRGEVLSITAGAPKEINFWTMKVYVGLIVRTGNSDVREANVQASFKRRTLRNRIGLDFVSNNNVTDGEEISNNQRTSAGWDRFINHRFFVKPIFGEHFRDPISNIRSRHTLGVGAGYQLIDSRKVDWEISGGPAYQETRFVDVTEGESPDETTPAFAVGTTAEWDITKWLEFDGQYRFQIVNEESGTYNHYLLISFETEITRLIDFDISWNWDRIQDPRQDSTGIIPEQDDFRTSVGLTFEF